VNQRVEGIAPLNLQIKSGARDVITTRQIRSSLGSALFLGSPFRQAKAPHFRIIFHAAARDGAMRGRPLQPRRNHALVVRRSYNGCCCRELDRMCADRGVLSHCCSCAQSLSRERPDILCFMVGGWAQSHPLLQGPAAACWVEPLRFGAAARGTPVEFRRGVPARRRVST
jgi:hypothetical protein